MQGGVAALLRPDGPWAPRVPRPGGERVVPALPERVADGVDGGKVQDVEAQLGQAGDLPGRPPQASETAGEQLVPGPEGGDRAVDPNGTGSGDGQVGGKLLPGQGLGYRRGQSTVYASGIVEALVS